MSPPLRDWYSSAVIGIAELLLAAPPDEPLTAEAIAPPLARGIRSVRDNLDRLHRGQMVSRAKSPTGGPGRNPYAYWLSEEQRPAALRATGTDPVLWPSRSRGTAADHADDVEAVASSSTPDHGLGLEVRVAEQSDAAAKSGMVPGQELVLVDLDASAYADVLEALSSPATNPATAAAWVAQLSHELVFAFDPAASIAAEDLLSLLEGARLKVRSGRVGHVRTGAAIVDQARRMSPEIRRARMTRDANHTPQ